MIEGLLWHYPQQAKPEHAQISIAADWVRDIGHFPADIIDAACTSWRRSPNSFAPTPGHLLEVAAPIMAQREFWLRLAEKELESSGISAAALPASVSAGGVDVSKLRRGA